MDNDTLKLLVDSWLMSLDNTCKILETDDKEFVLNWIYEHYPEPYKTETKIIFMELYKRILL